MRFRHVAIFVAGDRFLGKAHTLARALSRCCACNHLEIAAGDGHGWLWSVVAEAVVRACLTSIGIVRVLLRRLGLPRALCERGYRPSDRGHRRQCPAHHPGDIAAAAILLDRGWGKAKEMHEHSGQS